MKLLLDEMISGEVAERMRDRGHDVIAVVEEPALKGSSDPAIFATAQERERAVVTYNRSDVEPLALDYGERGEVHRGLILVNASRLPNDQFTRLVNAIEKLLDGPELYPGFTAWLRE